MHIRQTIFTILLTLLLVVLIIWNCIFAFQLTTLVFPQNATIVLVNNNNTIHKTTPLPHIIDNIYAECSERGAYINSEYGCCCDTNFLGDKCHKIYGSDYKNQDRKNTFDNIYRNKLWDSQGESKSGPGSSYVITKSIREWLPYIIRKYNITTFLDLPCGDFNWMRFTSFPSTNFYYVGGDIVPNLIATLRYEYYNWSLPNSQEGSFNARFIVLDGVNQTICHPFDAIFSRDVLVHLPLSAIKSFIQNLNDSGSKYFITTTFPKHNENHDIQIGNWRAINLQVHPFYFPKPIEILNEIEQKSPYNDKSIAMWKLPLFVNKFV